ncbi:hypothetical protein RDV64_19725 [Acuticoccus sp. MNP-M23]|uniref:hypothetical protein n=1 Tax=Acuticoccus sp. MNP-M23 TaxID=3072793 RepID=UPI002815BF7C|nr:hypothetical protein [Acuticoccus sp. MNP-M23]WMS42268.1 hypothetical protein RDV64_19725 [Acuticoccus sp. MNP-M23]
MSFQAILAGGAYSLNNFHGKGVPVILTYAFAGRGDLRGTDYAVADAKLKAAARGAMAKMEDVAGVRFVQVEPSADEMISIFYNDDTDGYSWANYPYTFETGENSSGSIGMNRFYGNYARGSGAFQIMLHELGHAVGLKHPFDGSPRLPPARDNTNHTVMSYDWAGPNKTAYQSLDVRALTYLYGDDSALAGVGVRWFAGADILQISGTARGDRLIGVNGDTRILGRSGNDLLVGRAGDDTLHGNAHWDRLYGYSGDDRLWGGDAGDVLVGGRGDDTLIGERGNDVLRGGEGSDLLTGGNGKDRLSGGDSRDTLAGFAHNDTLDGGGGSDMLHGGDGADRLLGGGGNDTISGGAGPDIITGGAGNDWLWGGSGGDRMFGGDGNDTLKGQEQPDILNGGAGHDILDGGDWSDLLNGANGNDTLFGGTGDDTLTGERGADILWGGGGKDRLFGGPGADTLVGDLWDDTLNGGDGQDLLVGGQGTDLMSGGAAADIFVLGTNAGRDTIADFDPDEFDRLMIRDLGISAEQALNRLVVAGDDMMFTWGGVETRLLGNATTNFDMADFIV